MEIMVVDVGQTCRRCSNYRGNEIKGKFFCMEYERSMTNPRYICKNFIDMESDKMISKIEIRKEIERMEQQRPRTLNEFNAREAKMKNLLDQLRARIGSD